MYLFFLTTILITNQKPNKKLEQQQSSFLILGHFYFDYVVKNTSRKIVRFYIYVGSNCGYRIVDWYIGLIILVTYSFMVSISTNTTKYY